MSLGKVREEILRGDEGAAGRINPHTGRPPTKPAIEKAAFAYVIKGTPEEVAEARKEFAYLKQTTEAVVVDDEYWGKWMIEMIRLYYRDFPHQQEKYIARHGLQKYVS